MKTRLLPASSEDNIRLAAQALLRGGLVAFPTDTVYGLGARAFDARAVESIYRAKQRPQEKAIPILLASAGEVDLVAESPAERAQVLARKFWPGPLTLVVPKNVRVPDAVAGATVGIRVPNHPVALALLRLAGPLAVTSANVSGSESPVSADDVLNQLDGRVEIILDAGRSPGGIPSTVVDCTAGELVILRAGPLSLADLQAAGG